MKTSSVFDCNSVRLLAFVLVIGFLAAPMWGQPQGKVTKLADGVYEIEYEDALDGFASGNTQ